MAGVRRSRRCGFRIDACWILVLAVWGTATAGTVRSDALVVDFASPEGGSGVAGLLHRRSGVQFLKQPESEGDALLWKLELTSDLADDSAFFGVTNRNRSASCTATHEGTRLVLDWRGIDLRGESDALDVRVQVDPKGAHGMAEWRIRVTNRSRRVGIYRVIFPVLELGRIGTDGSDDWLLAPPAEGRAVRDPLSAAMAGGATDTWEVATDVDPVVRKVRGGYGFGSMRPHGLPYPTARGQVQFCAYYEKSGTAYNPASDRGPGLYLATYDPAPHPKAFFLSSDLQRDTLTCEIAHYPQGSASPGASYELPYPVIVDGFDGDWFDAASLYRAWALRQHWCAKGPLHERSDVPDWLKRVTAVLRLDTRRGDNSMAVPIVDTYRKALPGVLLAQWYGWGTLEKTKSASAYAFPPVAQAGDGFRGIIERFADQQVYAMPYINARLWAARREGHAAALPYAARSRQGETHSYGVVKEDAVSGAAYMCVQTEFWQTYVLGVCREMKREFAVPALYLDQLTGAHFGGCLAQGGRQESGGCYNPTHGHPLGVTRSTVVAEHKRTQAILDALGTTDNTYPLCGEGTDETLIALTPVKLIHYELWPGYVPIFGRVYHDYVTAFGRTVTLKPSKIEGDPMPALSIGWQLVLGNQIGRVWPINPKLLDDPVVAAHLEYLRKACEVRDRYPQYLCLGEMLRPPRITGGIPELTTEEFRRLDGKVTLPAILAGTWRAPDGSIGVVVTNASQKRLPFSLHLDPDELGLGRASAVFVQRYPAEGQTIRSEGALLGIDAELPALGVAFYDVMSAGGRATPGRP